MGDAATLNAQRPTPKDASDRASLLSDFARAKMGACAVAWGLLRLANLSTSVRIFLLLLSFVFFVGNVLAAEKRNVVLFVCDDLGFQLGCYGDKVARTPNIDGLAKEGVRFTRAYCTTASCSPSRSVILTGMHNHANGMYGLQHTT